MTGERAACCGPRGVGRGPCEPQPKPELFQGDTMRHATSMAMLPLHGKVRAKGDELLDCLVRAGSVLILGWG